MATHQRLARTIQTENSGHHVRNVRAHRAARAKAVHVAMVQTAHVVMVQTCLLYTSPSPRD